MSEYPLIEIPLSESELEDLCYLRERLFQAIREPSLLGYGSGTLAPLEADGDYFLPKRLREGEE